MHAGQVIGQRFVLDRFVARGGMGDVYRAIDRESSQPVAVKLVLFDHPGLADRLNLEARALLSLDHPAIVQYVAHDAATGGQMFLAMEWLEGVTLADRLRKGPLSMDDSLTLAARVADALGAVHEIGMVHRDVKPRNLLLVNNRIERTKVLDFGIVRMHELQHITATGVGVGTPEYMAPEQVRRDGVVGPPADMFALGCVLFKCLTGRAAFHGRRVDAVLAKIAMVSHTPRVADLQPDTPKALDDLVARLMAHNSADRPQDGRKAAAMIRGVREALRVGLEPTARVRITSTLTDRELQPISVILAVPSAPEPGNAPEGMEALQEPPPPLTPPATADEVRRSDVWEPTEERAPEGVLVLRGRSDAVPILGEIRKAVEPFGARAELLLNGSFVVALSGGMAATDLAASSGRCALAIRSILPDAHIGVSTARADREDREALGPIIDRAASLLAESEPCISIDDVTAALLPGVFEVVAGKHGNGLRIERARAATADEPPRRLLGKTTSCVGRDGPLRQIETAFLGCIEEPAATALVVVGAAGVGKSRLRAEAVRRLRALRDGIAVVAAWGDPLRSQVPGGLLSRALRRRFALPDGDGELAHAMLRTRAVEKVPELRPRVALFLGELTGHPFPDRDSPLLRAARNDSALMSDLKRTAWEDWLAAECSAQPVLLVTDDLHWADGHSIELIAAGLRRARDLPFMVLALARPDVHTRFPTLADSWHRQEIMLDTLRPAACDALVREALADTITDRTRQILVERSAGNAFYLEELIRAAAAGTSSDLPDSVLASVQLHLARLPDTARQVVRAASIYGRVFWLGGVAALLGQECSEPELVEWLEALQRAEIVEHRANASAFAGESEYAFRHDLVREAAYSMLTDSDRTIGHRLAGEWLQEKGEPAAAVLAEHFAGGGASERAVNWFSRAAEQALAQQEAVADDSGPAPNPVDALRSAATYYYRAGQAAEHAHDNDNAVAIFERAAALWDSLDRSEAARCRLSLATVLERSGQRERALAELKQANCDATSRPEEVRLQAEILLRQSGLEARSDGEGALDRARRTALRARDLASDAGARDLEARALTAVAKVLIEHEGEEERARAIQYADAAIGLQRGSADVGTSVWRLANALLGRNDLFRAEALYRQALSSAEHSSDDALIAGCLANIGMVAFRRWQLDKAITESRRALAIYQRIGHRTRVREVQVNLGLFHQMRGDYASARTLLEQALATAGGDWIITTACHEALADLERHLGHEREAQILLEVAAELCGQVHAPHRQTIYLGRLAESLWSTGDVADALVQLERAAEVGDGITLSHALLFARLGKYDAAATWLESLQEDESDPDRRVAAKLTLARIHWWTGDVAKARTLCDDAIELLLPTRVKRFFLPAQALAACLDASIGEALLRLEEAREHCGHSVRAEMAIDLGTVLVQPDAPTPPEREIQRFLALCTEVEDWGLRYRLLDICAQLYAVVEKPAKALGCLQQAHSDVNTILRRLPSEHREVFASNPWVQSLRKVRLLP